MEVRPALKKDRLIDIVTIGIRTGLRRVIEIWFTNIEGRIVICGTPSADGTLGPRKPRSLVGEFKGEPTFRILFKRIDRSAFTRQRD